MAGILRFLMVAGGIGLVWLLWRLNEAIGNDCVLLLAGIVVGWSCMACVAVIVWAIRDTRRESSQAAPQTQERMAPVIVMLGDSRRYDDTPYSAPAGLFAPPPSQAKRQQPAQDEAWVKPGFRVIGENESYVDEW